MIAPAILKAVIVVGVVGELVTAAVAQTTGVDKTVVVGAVLTFGGLLVTSIAAIVMQQTAARNVLKAEAERAEREDERETREMERAEKARELLETSAVKTEQIHTLVNSKDDKRDRIISEMAAEIKELHAVALAKAEASPAVGSGATPAAIAPTAPLPATADPLPVVIKDTDKPVPVDVIVKTEPPKEKDDA